MVKRLLYGFWWLLLSDYQSRRRLDKLF